MVEGADCAAASPGEAIIELPHPSLLVLCWSHAVVVFELF